MEKEKPDEKKPVVYKDIHHAINEVYKRVGYVQKKGKIEINANRSYTVATEAEFISAIRPEMEDVGIYQQPYNIQVLTNERLETIKEYNGNRTIAYSFRSVIHAVYRFTHKDSGTFVDVPAIGEGQDSGDKSFYKAMTGANKYAVRQLFMIETGDDPDKHASVEQTSVIETKMAKSAFANAALLKKFTQNVIDSFNQIDEHDEGALETLKTLSELNAEKIAELKASGNEHDGLAVDEIRKQYALKKQLIDQTKMLNEQMRAK